MRRPRPMTLVVALGSAAILGASGSGANLASILVPLMACAAAGAVAWRAWGQTDDRLPFILLTTSILLAVAGFATFATMLDGEVAVLPNLAFLLSYPFAIMSLILMIRRRSAQRSIGHWSDALMVAGGFGLLTTALVGRNLTELASTRGEWGAFLVFAYPVLDVVMLTTCVLFVAQARKSSRALNGAGLAAGAMALADLVPLLENRFGITPRLASPLTCLSYLLMIWAVRRPFPSTLARVDTNTIFRALMIPGFCITSALVALLLPGEGWWMHAAAAGAIVASFGRISMAFREVRMLEQNRHEARTDELTNLPNRRALRERLQDVAADHRPTALLMVDLDAFKEINDTLGHDAGDEVLRTISSRLRRMVAGYRDLELFRLGGDEFALVLGDASRSQAIAEVIGRTISAQMTVNGVAVQQQVSIGSSVFPSDAATPSDLLRLADTAMYRAKVARTGYCAWVADDDSGWSNLELTSLVRNAIERRQIELHYQPQVMLDSGRLHGCEALLRLEFDGKPVNPLTIVRIAEQISLQGRLTEVVIERALLQQRAWLDRGLTMMMSINVSAADVSSRDFAGRVGRLIARTGAYPSLLCLEVTEEALLGDPATVHDTIAAIRALGVQIAMDDFGVGFSALTNLRHLELDELKLDRSFVTDLHASRHTQLLVQNVVDLGRRLGLRIVAEGVETVDELEAVRSAGITVGQGWYFAKAMPASDFLTWARRNEAAALVGTLVGFAD